MPTYRFPSLPASLNVKTRIALAVVGFVLVAGLLMLLGGIAEAKYAVFLSAATGALLGGLLVWLAQNSGERKAPMPGGIALRDSEQRLRTITDNLPALIAYVDSEQRYQFCNGYYTKVFSANGESLLGRTAREVLGDKAYANAAEKIRQVLQGERVRYERQGKAPGSDLHWRVDYIPDWDAAGKVIGFYVMVLDITELKRVESQLRVLARFDSLTGLANRNQFDEKLVEAIARNSRSGLRMALMYLDIDHFKAINDSLGHYGGDQVLRQFAQRLTECVRQTDTVARLAGDEFVIILEGLRAADEPAVIARKIIESMQQDFTVLDTRRHVTASIGIAVRQEESADALLRRADKALYLAKSAGRNTFQTLLQEEGFS